MDDAGSTSQYFCLAFWRCVNHRPAKRRVVTGYGWFIFVLPGDSVTAALRPLQFHHDAAWGAVDAFDRKLRRARRQLAKSSANSIERKLSAAHAQMPPPVVSHYRRHHLCIQSAVDQELIPNRPATFAENDPASPRRPSASPLQVSVGKVLS